MSGLLAAKGVGLLPQGSSLTTRLSPGQSLAVVGPAASGKSKLLRVLGELERPAQGRIELGCAPTWAGLTGATRRATPQWIAKRLAPAAGATAIAEALADTGLWDVRSRSLFELTPGQLCACEMLPVLLGATELLLVDGQLDRLDPWAWNSVWRRLDRRLAQGAVLVCATHRPDRLRAFTSVAVLDQQHVKFFGSLEELVRKAGPTQVEVETADVKRIRELLEPFEVEIKEREGGATLRAVEGREIAAKLLLEGYGAVRLVVVHEPTPEEALRGLF